MIMGSLFRYMKVAGIVVTYNRKELLLENIEALLKQTRKDCLTIIVVDNNSTDGTRASLEDYIKGEHILYVNTGKNLGGAGGFHYGIRYAAEHDFDYIWVMDDDCIPTQTALESFLDAGKKLEGKYGFLASKVLWKATQIVREYGLPIKEFFIWTDDWEYTRRISLKLPCYLVNRSVVIHKSKSNFGANIASELPNRLGRYDYLYRNDVFLYRREGLNGFLYEVLRIIFHTLKVIKSAQDMKLERLKKMYCATYRGLFFHPTIEFPKTN